MPIGYYITRDLLNQLQEIHLGGKSMILDLQGGETLFPDAQIEDSYKYPYLTAAWDQSIVGKEALPLSLDEQKPQWARWGTGELQRTEKAVSGRLSRLLIGEPILLLRRGYEIITGKRVVVPMGRPDWFGISLGIKWVLWDSLRGIAAGLIFMVHIAVGVLTIGAPGVLGFQNPFIAGGAFVASALFYYSTGIPMIPISTGVQTADALLWFTVIPVIIIPKFSEAIKALWTSFFENRRTKVYFTLFALPSLLGVMGVVGSQLVSTFMSNFSLLLFIRNALIYLEYNVGLSSWGIDFLHTGLDSFVTGFGLLQAPLNPVSVAGITALLLPWLLFNLATAVTGGYEARRQLDRAAANAASGKLETLMSTVLYLPNIIFEPIYRWIISTMSRVFGVAVWIPQRAVEYMWKGRVIKVQLREFVLSGMILILPFLILAWNAYTTHPHATVGWRAITFIVSFAVLPIVSFWTGILLRPYTLAQNFFHWTLKQQRLSGASANFSSSFHPLLWP